MSVNQYGVIARRHWARWLPRQYAAIGDPESFFTTLGEEVARQIDDLTDELASEIGQGDSYLARVGQLLIAWAIAEELILPQRVLPEAKLAAYDVQENLTPDELHNLNLATAAGEDIRAVSSASNRVSAMTFAAVSWLSPRAGSAG